MKRISLPIVQYRCKYMGNCPDMKVNLAEADLTALKNLVDQYEQLCTSPAPGTCLIYQKMERGEELKDISSRISLQSN
jgi:hypothetical protein